MKKIQLLQFLMYLIYFLFKSSWCKSSRYSSLQMISFQELFTKEELLLMCRSCSPYFYLRHNNFSRYFQKQTSGSVLLNSCFKTSYKILSKLWVVEWFCLLKIKKYIPNGRFLQKCLKFFRAASLTLSGDCFRGKKPFKKQPSEVSWNSCSEIFEITRKQSVIKCSGN